MKYYILLAMAMMLGVLSCQAPSTNNLNKQASLSVSDKLPENPLLEKVLTSSIHPSDSTMSTLYGNTAAYEYAMSHTDGQYPPGAILYEVTWKQKPDSLCFGANIPQKIVSVERIVFSDNSQPLLELYKGHPLQKTEVIPDAKRTAFIISQRIAVSP